MLRIIFGFRGANWGFLVGRVNRVVALSVLVLGVASVSFAEEPVRLESVDVFAQNLYPIGVYADYISTSVGGGAQLNLSVSSVPRLLLFASLEYGYGIAADARVGSINDIGLSIGSGWSVPVASRLIVAPELSSGILVHVLTADLDEDGSSSISTYVDQYLRADITVAWAMSEQYSISAGPSSIVFFQKENTGVMAGFQLGVRLGLEGNPHE
jgi:hypothetical protein